ncbi:MAG: head-tail connector protein [Ruminococcus sp.]|nr:head-tail connector protein [Ruminococcus sp.]
MIVTIDDVKNYLGIDYSDTMVESNLNRLISTAESYIKGAIGEDYPEDDSRTKELALIVISELYDTRGMSENSSNNLRKIINDISLQLRLESS